MFLAGNERQQLHPPLQIHHLNLLGMRDQNCELLSLIINNKGPNSAPYLARVIIYGLSGSFWTTQCILISLVSSENSCHYFHVETVVLMKSSNAPLDWLYSY